MATKKYISLSKLETFLDNLKETFASLGHKHTIADITDLKIDTSLSSTSDNPVANKTINEEFNAIAEAMNALDVAIDTKADASALSNYSTTSETKAYTDNAVAQKTLVQIITWGDDE